MVAIGPRRIVVVGVSLVIGHGCIIKGDCLYTPKQGDPWRATITATALGEGGPATVVGTASGCFSDEENTILMTDDEDDPQNVALRNKLLADAQVDCTTKAIEGGLTDFKYDPFAEDFDGIAQIASVDEPYAQAVENGLEGIPLKNGAVCPDMATDTGSGGDAGTDDTDT